MFLRRPEVDIVKNPTLTLALSKKPKVHVHELHDEGDVEAAQVQVVGYIPVFGPPGWTKCYLGKLHVLIPSLYVHVDANLKDNISYKYW